MVLAKYMKACTSRQGEKFTCVTGVVQLGPAAVYLLLSTADIIRCFSQPPPTGEKDAQFDRDMMPMNDMHCS